MMTVSNNQQSTIENPTSTIRNSSELNTHFTEKKDHREI